MMDLCNPTHRKRRHTNFSGTILWRRWGLFSILGKLIIFIITQVDNLLLKFKFFFEAYLVLAPELVKVAGLV
jgi:hypothetical protein